MVYNLNEVLIFFEKMFRSFQLLNFSLKTSSILRDVTRIAIITFPQTGYENTRTPVDVINASATDYEPVGQNQTSINEPVGDIHSSPTHEDVGLPTWAQPWSVPWDNVMVGTKVLGKGQFGEVRYGGVMIEGEFCKAAIKKLRGENCSPILYILDHSNITNNCF